MIAFTLQTRSDPNCAWCLPKTLWKAHKSFMQKVSQRNETVVHLLCECEPLAMSRGRNFGQSFGELQQLSHVPVDLFRRFATEIRLAASRRLASHGINRLIDPGHQLQLWQFETTIVIF